MMNETTTETLETSLNECGTSLNDNRRRERLSDLLGRTSDRLGSLGESERERSCETLSLDLRLGR